MNAGIDLGTSYSCISIINKNGKPESVKVSNGVSVFGDSYSLPSAIYVDNNQITIGQAALIERMKNPENFKSEFKRDLGQEIPYTFGNKHFYPQDLYKEIFIYLKKCAEEYTGETIDFACITHPANYNERKKKLVYEAAKTAGILNIELLDEPSAAAIYYCTDKFLENGSNILVYDFGGGTFDVSIIEYRKGKFELLTPPLGIERCGGIDIDRLIFDHVISNIPPNKITPLKTNPVNFKRFKVYLNEFCVKAKHHLSTSEVFSEGIAIGYDYENYELSRKQFNDLISDLVDDTFSCTNQILDNASKKISEIDTLLLVGGSTRIPLIREYFQRVSPKNISVNADPELAVSMGAAIYSLNMNQKSSKIAATSSPKSGNYHKKTTISDNVTVKKISKSGSPLKGSRLIAEDFKHLINFTEVVKGVAMEMVAVNGGAFNMGSDKHKDEMPVHEVILSSFHIGKFTVTQKQWTAVMNKNPSSFKGNNLPIENVSWNDCLEFINGINKLTSKNYRLPTEAEWEYASGGGRMSKGYEYSGSNDPVEVAWFKENSGRKTHQVGEKATNELNICDMSGNVWEWCHDWYYKDYYGKSSTDNPQGPPSGTDKVIRGGCWDSKTVDCRTSYRYYSDPSIGLDNIGFRLVLSSQ